MNRDYIVSSLYSLLPGHIRSIVTRGLTHGPPAPRKTYEDYGIEPSHLAHPNKAATAIWKNPEDAHAHVKSLYKLQKLGATAKLIHLDSKGAGTMFGKPIYIVNSFGVKKDQKTRTVADLSQCARRGVFDLRDPAAKFCYNNGWSDLAATMGFPNLRDYATLLLHVGPQIYFGNTDYSGWFNNLFSQPTMARYHCMAIKSPGKEDMSIGESTPIVALPVMTTLQGSKIAAVHCAMQSKALMMAITRKMRIETRRHCLSTPYSEVHRPEHYGLTKIPLSYQEMRKLKRFQPRISNPNKWIEQANELFCRWRTMKPGDLLPNYLVHQDDNLFAKRERRQGYEILKFMHNEFGKAVIPVSTVCEPGNISQDKGFCGWRLMQNFMISISEKRWTVYTQKVLALGYFPMGLPIGYLLSLAGNISYVMDLFPKSRPFFAPFTWFLSQLNAICTDKKHLWKIWKKKYIQVPPILISMVLEGWSNVYMRKTHALDLVRLGWDAKVRFSVDWCPEGGGSHNFTTGQYYRILWPKGHELTLNNSTKGEYFMLFHATTKWCNPGEDAEVDEDNQGCIAVVEKFKSKRAFGDIAIAFGRWCEENNTTIYPRYECSKDITADPLSRTNDGDWLTDYKDRCLRKGVDPGKEVEVEWRSAWQKVLDIRSRYPILHTHTHQISHSLIWDKTHDA